MQGCCRRVVAVVRSERLVVVMDVRADLQMTSASVRTVKRRDLRACMFELLLGWV